MFLCFMGNWIEWNVFLSEKKKFFFYDYYYAPISINPEIVYLFCWMHWLYFYQTFESLFGPEPSNTSNVSFITFFSHFFCFLLLRHFNLFCNFVQWIVVVCGFLWCFVCWSWISTISNLISFRFFYCGMNVNLVLDGWKL